MIPQRSTDHNCMKNFSRYAQDSQWHRATYLGMKNSRRHVLFEDYGTVEAVADSDLKQIGTDPASRAVHQHPTSILSCRLAHPVNPLEYAELSPADMDILRDLVTTWEIIVEVIAYQQVRLHSKDRIVLLIDAFTTEENQRNLLDVLLEKKRNVTFKPAYPTPVTFDSDPSLRACSILEFPPAHTPPFGEKIHVKLVHYFPEEGRAVLRYVPATEQSWQAAASADVKVIYADAEIVASLEETWAKDGMKLKPAEIISVGNSYLYRSGDEVCRAEVASLGPLQEDSLNPKMAAIELVDRGVEFDNVPVGEILALPAVISVVAPKLVFSAAVHLASGIRLMNEIPVTVH